MPRFSPNTAWPWDWLWPSSWLVHRDIKPANIFLCRYGNDFDFVKVLDFGLVKKRNLGKDATLTQEGQFLGTPAFFAPEMALDSELDGRADIYSLGCVAYWLLTGCLVFEADTLMAMAAKHLQEAPIPPSKRTEMEIPADLEGVVMDCLRKSPEERPAGASELADRLAACDVPEWSSADAKTWWELRT